jgi:hypothetical protein
MEFRSDEIMPFELRWCDLCFGGSTGKDALNNAISANLQIALRKRW